MILTAEDLAGMPKLPASKTASWSTPNHRKA